MSNVNKYLITRLALITALIFGTQPFFEVIAAVTGPQLEPKVGAVTQENVYSQQALYDEKSPLGAFQQLHLVGFHQISTHEQVNGNVITDLLDYHAPIEAQLSYVRQIQAETDVVLTKNTPDAIAVLGKNIEVQNRDQGTGISVMTTNGQRVQVLQPDQSLNPETILQDGELEFQDLAELKTLAINFNQLVSQYARTKGVEMITEGEQLTITFDAETQVQVENFTAETLANVKTIVIKGMPKTNEQTYFLNLDLQGQKAFNFPKVVIEYPNGEQVAIEETAELSNNLIWNLFDSKVENKLTNATVTINDELTGNLLAPLATFDLQASVKGFVIAEAIQVFAPTYAASFTGETINRAADEPETTPEATTPEVSDPTPEAEVPETEKPETTPEVEGTIPETEAVQPLVETYDINGLTVTKSIDKTNLTVGEEATVTLKVSGTQTATPAPITTAEDIVLVLDTSVSMKPYWDSQYKQAVKDFIANTVNTNVKFTAIVFNGPGPGLGQNRTAKDVKLLFDQSTDVTAMNTALDNLVFGRHVNDATLTPLDKASTNFADLFDQDTALRKIVIEGTGRATSKRVIIMSDWINTVAKNEAGPTTDTTFKDGEATSGYINNIFNQIRNGSKENFKVYPIQFGNQASATTFISNLKQVNTTHSVGYETIQTKQVVNTSSDVSVALSAVRLAIAGTGGTATPKLTLTDYLDLTKFEYVVNSAAITGATGTAGHSADTSTQTIKYSDITKGTDDVVVTYKIKAKTSTNGTNILLSPTTPVGAVVAGTQTQNIPAVTVNVNAVSIIDNTGLKAEANPKTIKQGEQTKIKLIVEGNEHENTDTSFFTYQGFESYEYPASANYSDGTSRDNKYHLGKDKGSTIKFTFTGKGFEWYVGNKHLDNITTYNMGNVTVKITDMNQNVISTETTTWGESNSNEDVSQQVYRKRDLNYGTYQVTITLNEAGFVYSDRVKIINPYGGTTDVDTVLTSQWKANSSITIAGSTGLEWYGKTTGEVAGTITIKEGAKVVRTINFKKNDSTEGLLFSESRLDPAKEYTATYTLSSGTLSPGKVLQKQTEKQSNINIVDYIDTTKFEFVPGVYTAMNEQEVVGSVEISTANQEVITLENIKVGVSDVVVEYDIKAKNTASEGTTITNPETQPGLVTATTTQAKSRFMDTPVTIAAALPTGNLTLNKTATANSDDTYSIMLEAKGTPEQTAPKTADIVIVIDKSGSMQDKIAQVKTAANSFVNNFTAELASGQVRIAIASFDYSANSASTPGASSAVRTAFTSTKATITTAINGLTAGGGTNTEDGIWRAQNLLSGARAGAKQYVVFFTDGLPTQSYSGGNGTTSDDRYFADAQEQYYRNFKGFNSPTSIQIGGLGSNQSGTGASCVVNGTGATASTSTTKCTLNLTTTPYVSPTYANARFYSVGLFTNATLAQRTQAINFLKTIQNVITPAEFGSKYYTQNLTDINGIFLDISNDIKADINNVIAKDAIIQDIVTKEFSIVANSWKVTDLQGKELTIAPENIIITKTANGEDEITFKIGQIVSDGITANGGGGVRITFKIKIKDDYFSGTQIPTNVNADINYTDPEDGIIYEQFFPIPTVDIAPEKAKITLTKSLLKNVNGELIPVTDDETDFTIVIERVATVSDPTGLVNYNQTYTLKSKAGVNTVTTDLKQLIGASTVSQDGTVILSTQADQSNYLIAGEYIVKEINLPPNYDLQEIKINGQAITQTRKLLVSEVLTDSKYQSTFTLAKGNADIAIEVVNKNTISTNLNKDKTATPVLDANGNPTGEYEIALNVKIPEKTVQYLDGNWQSNVSQSIDKNSTTGNYDQYTTNVNSSYVGTQLKLQAETNNFKMYDKGLGVHANSTIVYDLTKAPFAGYTKFSADVGIQVDDYGTNSGLPSVRFKVYLNDSTTPIYTSGIKTSTTKLETFSIDITNAKKLTLVVEAQDLNSTDWQFKNNKDWYDHANWADAKLTRTTTPAITNATITDIVTNDFNIITDGYGSGKTSLVVDANGTEVANVTKTVDGQTLTWSPLTIDASGLTIKFKVKPKDEYHAQDNVDTNVEATVKYDGYTEYFNKPSVDLGVKGTISITKNVLNTNNPNDSFKIKLTGGNNDETYDIELKASETKYLEVILIQDENTIVKKPGQKMTIGTYTVEEVEIPTDYTLVEIKIGEKSYALGTGATFTIDKTIPEISIIVANKVVPRLEKTATEVDDRIYEINLLVDSNGLNANNINSTITIEDIVTKEFEIITDTYYQADGSLNYENGHLKAVASGKQSAVKNAQETVINTTPTITKVNVTMTELEQIAWEISTKEIANEANPTDTGVSIKFLVRVKDDYFGGKDIPTNHEAHLKYTYPGGSEELLFPVPDVDVPYSLGSITVTKEIVDQDGKIVTDVLSDRFAISVVGTETYTFDLSGNTTESMSFYLKGTDTDISNNDDYSLNYLTAGMYTIEELIPMNYEQVQIWIDLNPSTLYDEWQPLAEYLANPANVTAGKVKDGKLVIGKDQRSINIKVTNTKVNDGYWFDQAEVINTLNYDQVMPVRMTVFERFQQTIYNLFN